MSEKSPEQIAAEQKAAAAAAAEKKAAADKAAADRKAEADKAARKAERAKTHPHLHDPDYTGPLTADQAVARNKKFPNVGRFDPEKDTKPAPAPQTKVAK